MIMLLQIRGLSTSTSSSNIGGYYGVGVVTAVGSNVKHVLANDYVFLVSPGTWTDSGVFSAKNVFKISGVSLDAVASISNAISAWGMLKTFEILQPGDVVVHDNGSTPIGKAIEDVGKSIGVKVINATLDELNSTEKVKSFGKVKLAVSGGGESSSKALLRSLSSGSLVVYNGSQPSTTLEGNGLSISMASAIFNGVAVSGFSLRAWAKSSPCKVQEAINDVTKLLASGAITSSAETFPQSDFLKALESVSKTSGSVVLKV